MSFIPYLPQRPPAPRDTSIAKPTAFLPEFGVRDARSCNRLTTKPTPAQIPTLIQCAKDNHASRDFISIWEDITVETGSMRPYNYNRDHHYSGIDTTSQLLPIRGTMTQVSCSAISKMRPSNEGKNCSITVCLPPRATASKPPSEIGAATWRTSTPNPRSSRCRLLQPVSHRLAARLDRRGPRQSKRRSSSATSLG